MLNKNLIIKNFEKSIKSYDENAIVQREMAGELIGLIKKKKFNNILEIGSYSGILTKQAIKNFEFKTYLALDIIDSFGCIKNLSPKISFQKIDIENFSTDRKFDLIISNASLQWCNEFSSTIKKLKSFLANNGTIAISIFGQKNLYEIKESFNVGLNYPKLEELKSMFSQNAIIIEQTKTLKFKSPKEVLLHMKLTGVNSIKQTSPSIGKIKENMNILNDKFNNSLTYNPILIIDTL